MAHSLKINGTIINFTATTVILEGKNNNSEVSGLAFKVENEPNNSSTHQYKVISSPGNTSLKETINLSIGDTLNVWTELSESAGDIIDTPRGTEVIISKPPAGK